MSSGGAPRRRTQAERRAETRALVLESACRLFGSKGYADTSLEEIAAACGTTIRPIYHYFGGKRELFAAVNEVMEERILHAQQGAADADAGTVNAWRAFLELCSDPGFRRVVLVDAPNVLGRERWQQSAVTRASLALFRGVDAGDDARAELVARMLVAALGEAALSIAESDDPERTSRQVDEVVVRTIHALLGTEEGR